MSTIALAHRPIPLRASMTALVVTDVVGGLLAVAAEVNTWGQAWGSEALLAAPVPMIVAQVLLTWLAIRTDRRRAAWPAGLLALARAVTLSRPSATT